MSVLAGKAAIVTGAARGIGRAAAELLAEHGASIVMSDVDAELAAETAAQIGDAVAVGGDLTEDGVPEAVVKKAVESFGRLDIVVNNAGYTWDGMAHKMGDDQFRAMLEIHTVVPFGCCVPPRRTSATPARPTGKPAARCSARSST